MRAAHADEIIASVAVFALSMRAWHAFEVMSRWSRQPIFVLLLGALLALGLSMSTVQASGMAAKMAVMADMNGMLAQGGCDGCGDDGTAPDGACLSVCAIPAVASGSPCIGAWAAQGIGLAAQTDLFPSGRVFAPDPRPPRSRARV